MYQITAPFKSKRGIASTATLFLLFVAFQFSKPNFILGNLLFGTVPSLYNLTLGQYFFQLASYPHIGKPTEYSHYQLSRTYFIEGKLDQAEFEAKEELALYPENKRTFYILGLTYGYMHREEDAIKSFGKFIEWKPDTWAARNDKAWLEFRIGRIDEALTTIQPVTWQKDNPWVQNTYGVLLMNKGLYNEAEQALQNAKKATEIMVASSWGQAYPGNDPEVYNVGLSSMKNSIQSNLTLVERKRSK